jgi:hypothetical protein
VDSPLRAVAKFGLGSLGIGHDDAGKGVAEALSAAAQHLSDQGTDIAGHLVDACTTPVAPHDLAAQAANTVADHVVGACTSAAHQVAGEVASHACGVVLDQAGNVILPAAHLLSP